MKVKAGRSSLRALEANDRAALCLTQFDWPLLAGKEENLDALAILQKAVEVFESAIVAFDQEEARALLHCMYDNLAKDGNVPLSPHLEHFFKLGSHGRDLVDRLKKL